MSLPSLLGPLTFKVTCCVCDETEVIDENEHADGWANYAGSEAHALCAAEEVLENFKYLKGNAAVECADVLSMLAGQLRAKAKVTK